MPIMLTAQLTIPSQCDAQREFMKQAEMLDLAQGLPAAISLAKNLIEEEVNGELLPVVHSLVSLLNSPIDDGEDAEVKEATYRNLLVEISDGIVDSVYVLYQLSNTLNLPFDRLFEAVHANNMSKLQRDADGKLLKREDGKLLKPAGYVPVDIRSILFPQAIGVNSSPKAVEGDHAVK